MKKSTILWSVLAVVFCALVIEHGRGFAAIPFQFRPNWLVIIPTFALWAALIRLMIRKEMAAAESRSTVAKAELAAVRARTPLADWA